MLALKHAIRKLILVFNCDQRVVLIYFFIYNIYKNVILYMNNVKQSAEILNGFLTPYTSYENSNARSASSEGVGLYRLSDIQSRDNCYMEYQNVSGNGLPIKTTIDLESELRGVTHIHSKSDQQQLKKKSIFSKKNNLNIRPNCKDAFTNYDIREKKSCKSTSNLFLERFDFPLDDYHIQPNSYIGVNTRLQMKKEIEEFK